MKNPQELPFGVPVEFTESQKAGIYELVCEANDAWFETMSQKDREFDRIHDLILNQQTIDSSEQRFIEYALGILDGYACVHRPIVGYEAWVEELLTGVLPDQLLAMAIKTYGYLKRYSGDAKALALLERIERNGPSCKEVRDALSMTKRQIKSPGKPYRLPDK